MPNNFRKAAAYARSIHKKNRYTKEYLRKAGDRKGARSFDRSCYSPAEFLSLYRYYQNDQTDIYECQRKARGYSSACLHHVGRNPHHWQYWYDLYEGAWQPIEMPVYYAIEMLCDYLSSMKMKNIEPAEYLEQAAFLPYLHPSTRAWFIQKCKEINRKGIDPVLQECAAEQHALPKHRKNPSPMPVIRKFFLHLHTIDSHRFAVFQNCISCGLYQQAFCHDLSKYEPTEFMVSVHYFQGNRSPYAYEKELYGYSMGWLHHKGRNKHHWEYWHDWVNGKWEPIPMPDRYFYEMVCDRVAACRIYQKKAYTNASPLKYFTDKKDKQFMNPETAKKLGDILTQIRDTNEKEVFRQIRHCL